MIMELPRQKKKSILKKNSPFIQRSNSFDSQEPGSSGGGPIVSEAAPRKRAVIKDEDRVFLPGEQDDDDNACVHCPSESVADRTVGERVSCRLIQQRSLDSGLYNELHKCSLEKELDQTTKPAESSCSRAHSSKSLPPPSAAEEQQISELEFGRLITTHSPSEEKILQMMRAAEPGKMYTVRDILAHRVPEIPEDEATRNEGEALGGDQRSGEGESSSMMQ
ncbi:unnamed protein product [Calicophoron daubneyi]|uniref:Uncharacterized protein n=1 Tax=Calicophoron daubneyi TaxID=300641 RepID=A0AAV2TH38_CALDB